jgi:ATP-dependent Lon protease
VRNLEREIAKLCRKAVTEIVKGKADKVVVTPENLEEYPRRPALQVRLGGADRPDRRRDRARLDRGRRRPAVDRGAEAARQGADEDDRQARRRDEGVDRRGLELCAVEGAGARAAKPPVFEALDIHVHVPEGATPKDGPSAGTAMVTSIVSVLTGIPVRRDVAMTGEVTLRGNVLPIGGLKEKLLAALRGGVTRVLIPEENVKDLRDIPENVKNGLELIPVSNVADVLKVALTRMPEPIDWDEEAEAARSGRTVGSSAVSVPTSAVPSRMMGSLSGCVAGGGPPA